MNIRNQVLNQTEESNMLSKNPLRKETVEALMEVLGGNDGAQVSIDQTTGDITVIDGDINVALNVPEILRKQEAPPETKS